MPRHASSHWTGSTSVSVWYIKTTQHAHVPVVKIFVCGGSIVSSMAACGSVCLTLLLSILRELRAICYPVVCCLSSWSWSPYPSCSLSLPPHLVCMLLGEVLDIEFGLGIGLELGITKCWCPPPSRRRCYRHVWCVGSSRPVWGDGCFFRGLMGLILECEWWRRWCMVCWDWEWCQRIDGR